VKSAREKPVVTSVSIARKSLELIDAAVERTGGSRSEFIELAGRAAALAVLDPSPLRDEEEAAV
jgi:metal-responsive CopG/Arc/MetJ family transcriptional regulator